MMFEKNLSAPVAILFAGIMGLLAASIRQPVYTVGTVLLLLVVLYRALHCTPVALKLRKGCACGGAFLMLAGLFLGRERLRELVRNALSFLCGMLFATGALLLVVTAFLGIKSRKGVKTCGVCSQLLFLLGMLVVWYASDSYPAVQVQSALRSTETVNVVQESDVVFFDAEGDENVLVFYPGAKVEYTAYAPLMRAIAEKGTDVFLLRVPFNLAFFDVNAAARVLAKTRYTHVVVGGHSLGGVAASMYAGNHAEEVQGVFLAASYPNGALPEGITVLSVYGTQDGVLNFEKLKNAQKNMPASVTEIGIEGGNHAQFGSYGAQKGDNAAQISGEEQRCITAEAYARVFLSQ